MCVWLGDCVPVCVDDCEGVVDWLGVEVGDAVADTLDVADPLGVLVALREPVALGERLWEGVAVTDAVWLVEALRVALAVSLCVPDADELGVPVWDALPVWLDEDERLRERL